MKTAIVLTVAVLGNSLGTVCLSKGMRGFAATDATGTGWAMKLAWHAASQPWVILGVLLLIVFLVSYMTALSWADLSFVLPATAPGYVLTAIFSRFFLNETISFSRWAGTAFIVAGTCLVARTYSGRTDPLSSEGKKSEGKKEDRKTGANPLATAAPE